VKKEEQESGNFIDLDFLIKSKNPSVYKWMPKILLRYLKRKIRQQEANQVLKDNQGVGGYEFAKDVIKRLNIQIQLTGLENVPKEGGAIFVVNHPLGGIDALAIIDQIYKVRPDMKFVVNDLLLHLPNLKDLFVGVNKHGSNSKESLTALNKLFESEQAIFVFPAGLVSRKKQGIVSDLEWKKTFVTRAKKFQKNVIPVHIDGKLTPFFYRLANLRSRIGIKANIEMFYLVDELFKQANKSLHIHIGKEIPYTTFDKTKTDLEWAEWVKKITYELPKK
jgi:putative hemolysin